MQKSLHYSKFKLNDYIVEYLGSKTSTSSKYDFLRALQLVWPSLYEIDAISKKNFFATPFQTNQFSQDTRAYKFDDDVAIIFGSHTASALAKMEDNTCSLVLPFKGKHQIYESECKLSAQASEQHGLFLSEAQVFAYTSDIEAVAVAFNPIKLESMMQHFSKNKSVRLPQHSLKIDFGNPRLKNLKVQFFKSLNCAGHFGAFDQVTADMILRHSALIMLVSMNESLMRNSFANNAQIIDRLCSRLYSDLSEPYTLTFMEKFSGLSARVLQKEFAKRFGMSPFAWLCEQRLFRARDLLVNPNIVKSVSEISRNCGFSHLGRFSVNFKNKFGVNASSFKKKL